MIEKDLVFIQLRPSKIWHLDQIVQESGVQPGQMLFFDDQNRN